MRNQNEDFTTLKKGDIIYLASTSGFNQPYLEVTVEKVTPTGRVTLERGSQFKPDGTPMSGLGGSHIYLKTPERVKYMEDRSARMNATREIDKINWKCVSTEKMLEILKIVNAKKEEEEV